MKKLFTKFFALIGLMLIGGVSVAWAEDVTVTWNYSCVSAKSSDDVTLKSGGMDLIVVNNGGGSSDYVNNAKTEFLHWNGKSSSSIRYAKFTAPTAGVVTVKFRSNNSSAVDRIVAVGKSVVTGADLATLKENANVYAADYTNGYTDITISGEVAAGDVYVYNANGGCNISEITYKYTKAASTATPSFATNLSNEAYDATATKSFSLSVVANDATGLQWYSCDDAQGNNAQAIKDATKSTYTFTPAESGVLYFYCVATNDNATGEKNATSNIATVNVADNSSYVVTWKNVGGWSLRAPSGMTSGSEFERAATIALSADNGASYHFVEWTVNGESVSTENAYTHTVTGAADIKGVYEANKKLIFADTNQEAYADKDGNITVPQNWYHYLAGKTVVSWTGSDGETYVPGENKVLTEDVTLTPNYSSNVKQLAYGATVTWSFAFPKSAPLFNSIQGTGAVRNYVQQANVNGAKIDVNMVCDATSGKIDNVRRMSNDLTQVNAGSKFTIPAVNGMVVKVNANANMSASTIAGSTSYTGSGSKSISYTYEGSDETIDIVINDGSYLSSIVVTYPETAQDPTKPTVVFSMKTAATGNVSVTAGADHEAIPDAANLTINGGSVTVSNGQGSNKNLVTSAGFCQTNGNTFFTVTLDSPLKAGDVISATMSATGRGLKFATANAYSSDYPGEAASGTAFSYTVKAEDDICGSATFNVFRATSNSTYFNDFKITRPASEKVTISKYGYATFSAPVALDLDYISGGAAYIVVSVDGDKVVTEPASGVVPANTGLIIKGEEGTCSIPVSAEAGETPAENLLEAVTEDNTVIASGYVLGVEGEEVMFLRTSEEYKATLAAGKAYLSAQVGGNARALRFVSESTGITNVATAAKDGVIYNIAGQRVSGNAKGLVIMNGKKFNIK